MPLTNHRMVNMNGASILLSSDLLKLYGDRAPDEEKQLYLENISTQVEHLTALIQDDYPSRRQPASDLHAGTG